MALGLLVLQKASLALYFLRLLLYPLDVVDILVIGVLSVALTNAEKSRCEFHRCSIYLLIHSLHAVLLICPA